MTKLEWLSFGIHTEFLTCFNGGSYQCFLFWEFKFVLETVLELLPLYKADEPALSKSSLERRFLLIEDYIPYTIVDIYVP